MLRLRLTLLLCLLALAGFAAATGSAASRNEARLDFGSRVSQYARKFIGTPYSYGGMSPRRGFDCSGLVAYVYSHFGVTLPHYSVGQFERGRRVSRRSLAPGDLVFFGLGHVGLYLGGGRFIHAPRTGDRVRVESLSHGWYRARLSAARRIIARV